MSGAQMAHFLKQLGKGSELTGISVVYQIGWLVGVGQTLLTGMAVYGAYRLGKWSYRKLKGYFQDSGYIAVSGGVA